MSAYRDQIQQLRKDKTRITLMLANGTISANTYTAVIQDMDRVETRLLDKIRREEGMI